MSPRNHSVPVAESQQHVIDPANPGGALDDGVEDRLHVRGRAADDAEHLGRRCLMLQRLAQFRVALLDFLEQPHVLDGDDGLGSAKVSSSLICLSEKGRTSVRLMLITPIGVPSLSIGVLRIVRTPSELPRSREIRFSPLPKDREHVRSLGYEALGYWDLVGWWT